MRPAVVVEGLAEAQVRWPQVPIFFAETRKLAQEWTYRFLAAAAVVTDEDEHGSRVVAELTAAPALEPRAASPAEIRLWAQAEGYPVSDRGRVPGHVVAAFEAAHGLRGGSEPPRGTHRPR